jgi:hypothetical protein
MVNAIQSDLHPVIPAYGGGAAASLIHPLVLGALCVLFVLIFLLPRRLAITPVTLGILLSPSGQNLYIAGAHFFAFRLIILVGLLRLLTSRSSREPFLAGGILLIDKVFLLWAVTQAVCEVLRYHTGGAAVNACAALLDSAGGYFLFRSLLRSLPDVRRYIALLAVVAVVASFVMLIEARSGHNIVGQLLGGIREMNDVRNGRIRAQGVFQHSILAGAFGACCFPLFLALWMTGKDKVMAGVGAIASVVMVLASASSTPVGSLLGCLAAIAFWPLRKRMRTVRWALLGLFVALALVMKSPVWYVLAHFDFVGGSGGWDRANLLDNCWQHIGDWWLIGTGNNWSWGYDMYDSCDEFVAAALNGGVIGLSLFIAIISISFRTLGQARRLVQGSPKMEWFCWLIGVSLVTHLFNFLGVAYYDQSQFVLLAFFALVPALWLSLTKQRRDVNQSRSISPEAEPLETRLETCPM